MVVAMGNVRLGQRWRKHDPAGDGVVEFEVTGFQRGPGRVVRVQGRNLANGRHVRAPLRDFRTPRLELVEDPS